MKPLIRRPWIGAACLAAGLLVLAVVLQWAGDAYGSEFGGHPDEAAHFVTGLMVRDYITGGIPGNPMAFAQDYYEHYPKVAIGHYPPGFYAVEGIWLTIFPVNRVSALLFMATLAAVFGLLVFTWSRAVIGTAPAALAAVLAVALPLTQSVTGTVMSDLGLAICVVLAAAAFTRFLDKGGWKPSLAFGLWATAATMMKGSGLFLALVPPLAIVLTRRFDVLKRPSLWIAVVPVALICGPWMLYSRGITAEGMIERSALEHLGIAIPYFGRQFLGAFTIAILIPAVAGLVRAVKTPTPFWAVCASLPVAMVVFYSLIPAGLEPRYLLPVIPSILFLAVHGLSWIPDPKRAALAGGIALIAFLALGGFSVRQKDFSGFEPAAEALLDEEAEHFLVSSDPRGEGAFIAEVAMRDPDRPSHTVSRASKVLSTSDWLGRGYALTYATDAELEAFIDETDFDGVVIDRAVPEVFQTEHHDQIARVMAGEAGDTSVAERPRSEDGEIRFYKDPMR